MSIEWDGEDESERVERIKKQEGKKVQENKAMLWKRTKERLKFCILISIMLFCIINIF